MANQYRSVLAGAGGTGGDAVSSEVLSGKTFTNDNGPQTGSMTNNGAVTQTLTAGQSYTIPEGYHNGNGTVTATNNAPDGYIYAVQNSGAIISGFETLTYTTSSLPSAFIFAHGYTTLTGQYGVVNGIKNDGTTVEIGNLQITNTLDISDYDFIFLSGQIASVSNTLTIS